MRIEWLFKRLYNYAERMTVVSSIILWVLKEKGLISLPSHFHGKGWRA